MGTPASPVLAAWLHPALPAGPKGCSPPGCPCLPLHASPKHLPLAASLEKHPAHAARNCRWQPRQSTVPESGRREGTRAGDPAGAPLAPGGASLPSPGPRPAARPSPAANFQAARRVNYIYSWREWREPGAGTAGWAPGQGRGEDSESFPRAMRTVGWQERSPQRGASQGVRGCPPDRREQYFGVRTLTVAPWFGGGRAHDRYARREGWCPLRSAKPESPLLAEHPWGFRRTAARTRPRSAFPLGISMCWLKFSICRVGAMG